MSKLCPFHNNFPLTALNEDFVMCIAAIMGSSESTTNSASASSRDMSGQEAESQRLYLLKLCDSVFLLHARINMTSRTRKTPRYNQAGEMPDRCPCYLMFSISNTHPSAKPQIKQVCWGPALSNPGETPWWLVHTWVRKIKNGKEVRTWEIYCGDRVIVVKTDGLISSLPAGTVGAFLGGGALYMDGWEPVDLHNLIIGNNHIMVIDWLKHLYGWQ